MRCYETFELNFQGAEPEGSHAEVALSAVFTCGEKSWNVKGFYAGDGTYKVRFLPQKEGEYTWKVSGIFEAEGSEVCTRSNSHGMVQTEGNHFVYQDGSKYLPFGTTIYALSHQPEERIDQTMETLKGAPFNKVRHCVFPKHYDYNHNDPQFYPFEKKEDGSWDVHHPCFAYWDHLETIIRRLEAMGIESDLILFHAYDRWGFAFLTMEETKVYLDYLMRRLSAIPCVWWSMANEYDIMTNYKMEDWYEIEKTICENDPYHHLLSNHNCMHYYDHSREAITHCSMQTIAVHKGDEWQKRYKKPVIFDEFCYEGNIQHEWGNISGFEMTNRFWKICTKGAYGTHGETFYSEDEVLWWAKGGVLKGTSPKRIAYLKDFLYSLPSCLEPWEEPVWEDIDKEFEKDGENPFLKLKNSLTPEEKETLEFKSGECGGHCGDEVFLKYFGIQCAAVASIKLPKDHKYKVEIIDVWEMTRETLMEEASGSTALKLPGKEGIAVVATKIV